LGPDVAIVKKEVSRGGRGRGGGMVGRGRGG